MSKRIGKKETERIRNEYYSANKGLLETIFKDADEGALYSCNGQILQLKLIDNWKGVKLFVFVNLTKQHRFSIHLQEVPKEYMELSENERRKLTIQSIIDP